MATKLTYNNMEVKQEGTAIVLPERMAYQEAIVWITRKMESEEEVVQVSREYKCFPMDGAAALTRAIAKVYGWAQAMPTGFFGENPPQQVEVATGHDTYISVSWGDLAIPDVGVVRTAIGRSREGLPVFRLMARLKQKNRAKLEALFEQVQNEVDAASIYRGKAVRFRFPSDDPDDFDPTVAPTFLDLSRHNPDEVVFPRDIQHLVDMTLLTPLRHTQVLRDQGIPLKRGVLLAGEYGVGKTLLAYKTAHVAVNNGWSYLYAEAGQLRQAIEYGLLYEPCVIFAEDLDSALGGQTRSDAVNDVLNTIDGVNVKGREVMVVLTTNHLDKINQAMLRPGRLDAVIRIPPPDADAAERLIRLYARGRLAAGEKLMDVGARLAGQIPSAIREVVERAKLATITRTGNGDEKLTASDLLLAAHGMQHHLELLQPRPVDTRSDIEKAAGVLVEGITAVELRSNGNGHDRDPLNLDELPYTPGSLGLTYRE